MRIRYFISGILMIMYSQFAFTQICFPVKKGWAYFQPVTAGTMSKAEAKNREQKGNYLIYFTSKSDAVGLKNIWINGELHHGNLLEVNSPVLLTPVTAGSAAALKENKATLVPANKLKTYQIVFTALNAESIKPVLPKKYSSAPVVLEIQYKNRKKFITLNSIKQLDILPLY
jgi:hypothetical protein